jgi:hypothetical protein
VLISPQWIQGIDWPHAKVNIYLTRGQIDDSPEFDVSGPLSREYEERLYDFYGRAKYWGI